METLNISDPTDMPHPGGSAALTDLLLTDHATRREADS